MPKQIRIESLDVLKAMKQVKERESMPKCGVCGWSFGGWAMTKHAETPCGEESEKAKPFTYCDGCGGALEYKQWRYIPSGGTFLCDNCNDERIRQ